MEIELPTLFYLTNALIIGWSAFAICKQMRRLDFYTIFYLFALFFFGIAPLVQWYNGLNLAPMYDEELTCLDFLRANLVLLVVFAGFELLYWLFYRVDSSTSSASLKPQTSNLKLSTFPLWLLVVAAAVLVFLWYQQFNPLNLLFRGGAGERENENKIAILVCGYFCRYIPVSAALIYQLYGRHRKTVGIVLWFLVVACCFPTGMARLQIVPVYLPAAILLVPFLRERKYLLVMALVSGLLVVFPFLHMFRDISYDMGEFRLFDFSFFNALHFDSFASLAYIIKQDFVTGGEQLLGALLFWIPRSLWPDKPIESGRMLAETFDLGMPNDFTNIAVNWFGEGYLNYGYLGVAIWLVALVFVCARADRLFWSSSEKFSRPAVIYYFSGLGMLFFVLRGDMMSGVAFSAGLMASHKIMEICMLRRER